VRKILEVEQPDVIWSQSKWSAEGLKQLNIPIVCSIHDGCKPNLGPYSTTQQKERIAHLFLYNAQWCKAKYKGVWEG